MPALVYPSCAMTTRGYTLRRGSLFTPYATVMLVVVSLVFLWVPLSQLVYRQGSPVFSLPVLPFLVMMWYLRLKPVEGGREVEEAASEREELDRRLEGYRRDPEAASPWSEVKERIPGRS